MKSLLVGIAALISLPACGSEVIVGGGGGGNATLGTGGAFNSAGAFPFAGGSDNAGGAPPIEEAVPAACTQSPAAYETYSTAEELNALLVGRWRRCIAPQIAGEDVGVEFTEDGKVYP